jgi:hypothetical protein
VSPFESKNAPKKKEGREREEGKGEKREEKAPGGKTHPVC